MDVKNIPVRLIWAQAYDLDGNPGAMGFNCGMPWHLPADLKYFKSKTEGCPVIMGRRSWEALPKKYRPLPDRKNIVVSRDPHYDAKGAEVCTSIENAIDCARNYFVDFNADCCMQSRENVAIWVIGGGALLHFAAKFAESAYVTDIQAKVSADTYAPSFCYLKKLKGWSEISREDKSADIIVGREKFSVHYSILKYGMLKSQSQQAVDNVADCDSVECHKQRELVSV